MNSEHRPFVREGFPSDEGCKLEMLDFTICNGSTPTFLYFNFNFKQVFKQDFSYFIMIHLVNNYSSYVKKALKSGFILGLATSKIQASVNLSKGLVLTKGNIGYVFYA